MQIRSVSIAIIAFWFAITNFVSGKSFPFLMESVGLHGCLSIHAFGCIVGSIFVLFVLNETTGKSLDDDIKYIKESQILNRNTNGRASVCLLKSEKNEII